MEGRVQGRHQYAAVGQHWRVAVYYYSVKSVLPGQRRVQTLKGFWRETTLMLEIT